MHVAYATDDLNLEQLVGPLLWALTEAIISCDNYT